MGFAESVLLIIGVMSCTLNKGWCLWLCREKNCSRELSPWWPPLCRVETSSSHSTAGPWWTKLTWMMRTVMMFKRKKSLSICPTYASVASHCCFLSASVFPFSPHVGTFISLLFIAYPYTAVLGCILPLVMPDIWTSEVVLTSILVSAVKVVFHMKHLTSLRLTQWGLLKELNYTVQWGLISETSLKRVFSLGRSETNIILIWSSVLEERLFECWLLL